MTHKLTVRFGGAADSEVHDYSDRVRYVDGTGPAILGGMQADNGSSSMGQFVLDDEDNDIPHRTDPPGLQLAAHNQLIWSEDSPGYEAWLSIGRIDNKSVGRPYTYTAGVNRQWTGQWADANFDLDGITLTADEDRPAESDVDRVLWALATFCAGNYRLTTDFGTHLVASSPSFTMDAKTYPAGTELLEILEDCGQLAGKRYAVVIHEDSGADHACFQYIDEEDHTTYPCTLSISDQLDEVDGETVFEPVWRQGSATTEAGQELITGVVSRYGADTSATVFAEDTDHADAYDRWIKPYNDDLSVSAAQATARATAIVHSRWNEHVSHQPSILIPARLHNLIRAGMSISIKAAAAMGGQYLGTEQTRRIAAIEWGAAGWRNGEIMLWANLQLDRTPRQLPLSNGKPQPAATSPQPPSGSCTDVTASKAPHFIDGTTTDWGVGGNTNGFSTTGGGHNGADTAGVGSGLDVNLTLIHYFTGTFTAGKTYTLKYWYWSNFTNTVPASFGSGTYALSGTPTMTDGETTSVSAVNDDTWRFHQLEWTPSADRSSVIVQWGNVSGDTGLFLVSDGSLEECGAAEAPITIGGPGEGTVGDGTGETIPPGTVIEHGDLSGKGGTMHDATQIEFDSTGLDNTDADDVQEAIEDLDAAITAGGGGGGGSSSGVIELGMPYGTLERSYDFTSTVESWTTTGGTLSSTGGRLRLVGSGTALEPSGASSIADGEVVALLDNVSGDANPDLVFRATDANNFYLLECKYSGSPQGVSLYKQVAGSYSFIGGGVTIPLWGYAGTGKQFKIMVRFVGSKIQVYLEDAHLFSAVDTQFTTGRIGFVTGGTNEIDAIRVYSITTETQGSPGTGDRV